MTKTSKILGRIIITTGVFLFLSAGISFATTPVGSMRFATGVSPYVPNDTVQDSTVGSTTALPILRIFANGTEVTNADDIYVKIPDSVDAIWDTSVTTITAYQSDGQAFGTTSTGTVSTTVDYPSTKVLHISVTADFNNEPLFVEGLAFLGKSQSSAAALVWSASGNTFANYSAGDGGTSAQVSVTAGDSSASAVKSTPTVGSTGNVALTLTLPRALTVGEKIKITFPDSYYVVANSGVSAGGITGNTNSSTLTASVSGQILIFTVATDTLVSGGHVITIPGADAIPQYVDSTNISLVTETTSGDYLIATDSSVALTDTTVGALSSASIVISDMTANQYNKHTINFTTSTVIPNLGHIKITYPAGWDVSGVVGVKATNLSGLDGVWTATVSGQVITFTQTGGSYSSAGAKRLRIEGGLKTPSAPGAGGNATILTELADGTDIETVGSISTGTVTPGANSSSEESSANNNSTNNTTNNSSTTTNTETSTTIDTTKTQEDKSTTVKDEVKNEKEQDSSKNETTNPEIVKLSDIDKSWAKTEIEKMTEKGIVKGNKDGTFKPENFLNKADAAVLICRVMKIDEMKEVDADPASDVKKADYFGSCVSQLKSAKVVTGNPDGTYTPGKDANRAEFIALALRAYGTTLKDQAKTDFEASMTASTPKASFKDVNGKDWYANVAATAKDMKFVNGRDGNFDGAKSITRAEATTVLYRIFKDLL